MKHILILLSFFLLTSCDSWNESGVLYKWQSSSESEWKKFGDDELHQKYIGEILNDKPNGDGILYSPEGSKIIGIWRNGELVGWYKNGKPIRMLFCYDDGFGCKKWSTEESKKDNHNVKYEGEFSSKKADTPFLSLNRYLNKIGPGSIFIHTPHGIGTSISKSYFKEEKYDGNWKYGRKHGKGSITYLTKKYIGIKQIGEWINDSPYRTTTYNKDGSILGECIRSKLALELDEFRSEKYIDNNSDDQMMWDSIDNQSIEKEKLRKMIIDEAFGKKTVEKKTVEKKSTCFSIDYLYQHQNENYSE